MTRQNSEQRKINQMGAEMYGITGCFVERVRDMESLKEAVHTGRHDIDEADFARRLGLAPEWDWSDIDSAIEAGHYTAEDVDKAIHAGLR